MSPPTKRQRQFEIAFTRLVVDGVSPTFQQVGRELGISTTAAHSLARGLIKRGRGRNERHCERSFELITKEGGTA